MSHTDNPSAYEAEAEGSPVWGQLETLSETLSQNLQEI